MDERAKGLWGRAYQVGVVVRDMDKAVKFYERLGIGPFTGGPSSAAIDRRIYGQLQPDALVEGRIAQMGNIEFELLSPVRGRSVQQDVLDAKGEGVVHICGHTDDLKRDTAIMTDLGYPIISSARFGDGGSFAYFDTREIGGVVLELFQPGNRWK